MIKRERRAETPRKIMCPSKRAKLLVSPSTTLYRQPETHLYVRPLHEQPGEQLVQKNS